MAKKETYTLTLTAHQAHVLNSAVQLAKQAVSVPPGTAIFQVPTEGIEQVLVKDELTLIAQEVVRQFKEQDAQ